METNEITTVKINGETYTSIRHILDTHDIPPGSYNDRLDRQGVGNQKVYISFDSGVERLFLSEEACEKLISYKVRPVVKTTKTEEPAITSDRIAVRSLAIELGVEPDHPVQFCEKFGIEPERAVCKGSSTKVWSVTEEEANYIRSEFTAEQVVMDYIEETDEEREYREFLEFKAWKKLKGY
jgi:hypothetical protein